MSQLHTDNLLPTLPKTLLAELFAKAERVHLPAGHTLFRIGDTGNGCYQVVQGVVKVVITSEQASERIIAILGAGSCLGELSMLDGLPRSASIVAIQECQLLFVTRDAFRKYARQHPEVYEHLTVMLSRRLRETDDLLAATSFLTVKARLARSMLELVKHLGQRKATNAVEIPHRITQSDLAAMAGIARENVSRTLMEWKQQEIVTQSSQFYCVKDVAALERQLYPNG